MLEHPCLEFVGLDLDDLTVQVDAAHEHGLRTQHLDVQTGNRQAPLVVHPLAVGFDDLRVDDRQRVLVDVPHDDLLLHTDLRRGERNAVARVDQCVEHVVDEADDLTVDIVDLGRDGLEDRIAVCSDLVRHVCQATGVSADRDGSPPTHYFDEQTDTPSSPIVVDVTLPDTAFTMETDRGVFSHGHLDTATSLLLPNRDSDRRGGKPARPGMRGRPHRVDDGPTVTGRDRVGDRRQPAGTRTLPPRNAERNGIRSIRVAHPDEVPAGVTFETIWSNPPIRIGKAALHELLVTWMRRLTPDGRASLVVQKHLGADSLQKWLGAQGWIFDRTASKAGFRVLTSRAGA